MEYLHQFKMWRSRTKSYPQEPAIRYCMNSKATELEQVVPNDIEHRAKNPESHSWIFTSTSVRPSRGLPSNRPMGMCCWMGSHFQGWIDYNGVAFSLALLEWDRTFSGFGESDNSGRWGFKNGKIFTSFFLSHHFRMTWLKDFIR